MKTLIVYSSMYGCTANCAQKLKAQLTGDVSIVSASEKNIPDVSDFDTVILGSSIKIGKIGNALAKYIKKNCGVLLSKRVGFFICSGENNEEYFTKNFPEELIRIAIAKEFFGGEIAMANVGLLVRLMLRMVGKEGDYSKIDEARIASFATTMNG